MKTLLKTILLTICLFFLWTILIVFGTLSGWWRQSLTNSDNPDDFIGETKKEIHSDFGKTKLACSRKRQPSAAESAAVSQ